MKQNPALTYEQLLLLELDQIRELFPHGAREWKKRWLPVLEGDEADRPLKRLLKDKRDLRERPRYPASTGSHRLRWDKEEGRWVPAGFSGDEEHGYTSDPGRAVDHDPKMGALDAVDAPTQERFSKEAWSKRSQGEEGIEWQARALANKLAKVQRDGVKVGVDLGPALMQLIREAQAEIQQRKAA